MLYTPLEHRQIRLLTMNKLGPDIDPTQFTECRTTIVHLDHAPRYKALSYIWGDRTDAGSVIIDGISVESRSNLLVVLRRLREMNIHFVWIDASLYQSEYFYMPVR